MLNILLVCTLAAIAHQSLLCKEPFSPLAVLLHLLNNVVVFKQQYLWFGYVVILESYAYRSFILRHPCIS